MMAESNDARPGARQVGVLLVTHGEFGAALLGAAQLIVGPQEGLLAVSVLESRGVDDILAELKVDLAQLEMGIGRAGVDGPFGGTPTTLSLSLRKLGIVEVVAGGKPSHAAQGAPVAFGKPGCFGRPGQSAGVQGIVVPGEMLRKTD
jgi:PTS system mannose-specific IIA component